MVTAASYAGAGFHGQHSGGTAQSRAGNYGPFVFGMRHMNDIHRDDKITYYMCIVSRWISSIVSCWTAGVGVPVPVFFFCEVSIFFCAEKQRQQSWKQLHDEIKMTSHLEDVRRNFLILFDAPGEPPVHSSHKKGSLVV